jgi:hypothetical protein
MTRTIRSFLTAVAVLAVWSAPYVVFAASCTVGPYAGTCKETCTADEIWKTQIDNSFGAGKYQASDCGPVDLCCIPKGDALCLKVSAESGEAAKEQVQFNCAPSCATTRLADKFSLLGETCKGSNVCCSSPPRTGTTTVTSPFPTTPSIPASIALTNPLGAGASFYTIIKNVIMAFLGMVGGLALLVFVYAGILWMTAGSSDRVQKAKDAMKYAVIGLALIAFSYVITSFVINGLTGKIAAPTTPTTPDYAQPSGPNP